MCIRDSTHTHTHTAVLFLLCHLHSQHFPVSQWGRQEVWLSQTWFTWSCGLWYLWNGMIVEVLLNFKWLPLHRMRTSCGMPITWSSLWSWGQWGDCWEPCSTNWMSTSPYTGWSICTEDSFVMFGGTQLGHGKKKSCFSGPSSPKFAPAPFFFLITM